MEIKKVLYIEDSTVKMMDVLMYLKSRQGIDLIDCVGDTRDAIKSIEDAIWQNDPYDLLISDMHFSFFGNDDREAGEKTFNILREKGYTIPVILCSSQNWKIPGMIGNIFYSPRRDWEQEADALFKKLRAM